MTDKYELPSGILDIKLGESFRNKENKFCAFRYEVKPDNSVCANADSQDSSDSSSSDGEGKNRTRLPTVKLSGSEYTVTHPSQEDGKDTNVVYKGPKRPCVREYGLIIDHDTGEITLEKISTNCLLKRFREESSTTTKSRNQSYSAPPLHKINIKKNLKERANNHRESQKDAKKLAAENGATKMKANSKVKEDAPSKNCADSSHVSKVSDDTKQTASDIMLESESDYGKKKTTKSSIVAATVRSSPKKQKTLPVSKGKLPKETKEGDSGSSVSSLSCSSSSSDDSSSSSGEESNDSDLDVTVKKDNVRPMKNKDPPKSRVKKSHSPKPLNKIIPNAENVTSSNTNDQILRDLDLSSDSGSDISS